MKMVLAMCFVAVLALVGGCSSPAGADGDPGEKDAASDAGPTWLDSSPATLDEDAGDAADVAVDVLEAAAPICTHKGSCGGSWEKYECPQEDVPPAEAHCTLNEAPDAGPDAGPTREWCCYGSQKP